MKLRFAAVLPALALALAFGPDGSGQAPPHLSAAIAEQRNLVSMRPRDAGVWNDLGNLLALSGNLDEADSAYGRALELDPSSVQARFNLGVLRQQRGDLEGAVAEYQELLAIDPRHAWALYQLGAAYEAQGERDLALDRYAAAFTLDPELLFAETNPHIIENRLVTEALLRARRGQQTRPAAPRSYDEAARINSILTPPPPAPPAVASPRDENDDEDAAESALPATPSASASGAARDHIGRGSMPRDRAETRTTASVAAPKDRVLDSTDLRGSVRNQVRGNADGGDSAPAAPNTRRRSASMVTPGGRRSPVSQSPVDDGGDSFGLGQRSTGSLEWKLGPASDQPVPAR
jgi:hypothetical protein